MAGEGRSSYLKINRNLDEKIIYSFYFDIKLFAI